MESELSYILKLLDDPDTTVQKAIKKYVQRYNGDMSQALAKERLSLTASEKHLLTHYTHAGRKEHIIKHWQVPTRFLSTNSSDWDTFEYLLSLISDFLHDGISPRKRMSDAVDTLADEALVEDASQNADMLAKFLFSSGRLTGNKTSYFAKHNSDLAWVIESSIGNPISLCIIYMLLGNRFGLEVYGCNYPGHFLAWVNGSEKSYLVDTYNRARILDPNEIIQKNPSISEAARDALQGPCSFSTILQRVLSNLETSFTKDGMPQESEFFSQLKHSLVTTSDLPS